jgi:hypothetical protein
LLNVSVQLANKRGLKKSSWRFLLTAICLATGAMNNILMSAVEIGPKKDCSGYAQQQL